MGYEAEAAPRTARKGDWSGFAGPERADAPGTGPANSKAVQTTVTGFLTRCRHAIYRREAARAGLWGLAALAAIALALPVAGYLAIESRQATITLFSTAGLVGCLIVAATALFGLIAPRRRYSADADVARWVGARRRAVASDLLSSVELDASLARPDSPSQVLVDALRADIASRLAGIDPRSLFSAQPMRHARAVALAAVAANVVVAAAAPEAVTAGWKRLTAWPERPFDGAELSSVPLVGDLQITLTAPPYAKRAPTTQASTSGDLRGLAGTVVALKARILVPAAAAELLVQPTRDETPRSVTAVIDNKGIISAELILDNSARYRFGITSPSGARIVEAMARSIDVEADQPPVVQLTTPGEPLEVSNVKRIELGYSIEDDFAVSSAELVWESGPRAAGGGVDRGRKPLAMGRLPDDALPRVQGKLTWDIAEVNAPMGNDIRYWIEAKDNDGVAGPKIGRSREFHLRVASPRARHEATLERQQHVAMKLLANLGGRLVGSNDDLATRSELSRQLRETTTELRAVATAFEKDPHASDRMRKALVAMTERIERFTTVEQRQIHAVTTKEPLNLFAKTSKAKPASFAAADSKLIGELEDDAIVLADWLDRERVESLLDLSDEVAAHQRRLADLLAEHARTKERRLVAEIDRELGAIERAFAELAKRRSAMPEDVLDQYIHREAAKPEDGASCVAQVAALARSGQTALAQAKLSACQQQQQRTAQSLEGSLARVRGDKFSEEQNKLDEVMNELSDIAKDQRDIAADSSRIFDSYARKAKELAREHRREASKATETFIDKLRKRINAIDEVGLTPFAQDELDIVLRRFTDLEQMVDDGDLAEAFEMAHQAKASLDTIAGELTAVLSDDPKSKWAGATQEALDGIHKARSMAKELVQELGSLAPRPDEIMSDDDKRYLDRLRRRQGITEQRAKRLDDRTQQLGTELPGDASRELAKRLGTAVQAMDRAVDRMKAKDPAGARASTGAAADELAKARETARGSARQAQISAIEDEPIRIPGADEYKTPVRFREQLLEAMKHKSAKAPEGYDLMIKRYFEDLAK